jgi:SAM-dependent methyltransferase
MPVAPSRCVDAALTLRVVPKGRTVSASENVPASQSGASSQSYLLRDNRVASDDFNRRTAAEDASHLIPHLKTGMRVVDFGCGTGSITPGLAATVTPGEVVGFDMSETAVARARTQAQASGITNVRFSVANLYELELDAESFDAAHFSGVLEHLTEPQRALDLAYRALKSGGVIAAREKQADGDWVVGPHREALVQLNDWGCALWRAAGGDQAIGQRLGTLLRAAGFTRIDVRPGCLSLFSTRENVVTLFTHAFTEPATKSRVVELGARPEQLQRLLEELALWGGSDDSVAGFAQCTAIGFKA